MARKFERVWASYEDDKKLDYILKTLQGIAPNITEYEGKHVKIIAAAEFTYSRDDDEDFNALGFKGTTEDGEVIECCTSSRTFIDDVQEIFEAFGECDILIKSFKSKRTEGGKFYRALVYDK